MPPYIWRPYIYIMTKNFTLLLLSLLATSISFAQAPQYAFNKILGGGMNDIVVGSDGSLYVTGTWTGVRDFDPGAAANNITSSSSGTKEAAFLGKYTANGDFVWVRTFTIVTNYIAPLQAVDLEIDDADNLYLLLSTSDMNIDADASIDGVSQPLLGGDYGVSGVAAKYNADGDFQWSAPIGRHSSDAVYVGEIVTNGQIVLVTGSAPAEYYGDDIYYGPGGSYFPTPFGFTAQDMGFTVAWNAADGSPSPTNLGFTHVYDKVAPKVAFDELGYRYVLSYSSYSEDSSVKLIKYEPNSSIVAWQRNDVIVPSYYISGISSIQIAAIDVDNDHNIYIAGNFGTDSGYNMLFNTNPVTALPGTNNYSTDNFVFKTNSLGYGIDVIRFVNPTINTEGIADFELNRETGKFYITGSLMGAIDFNPDAPDESLSGGGYNEDYFIARFNTDLNFEFAGKYDGIASAYYYPTGLAFNNNNELLVSGYINNGPVDIDLNSASTVNATAASSNYGMIVSYAACSAAPGQPASIVGPASVCAGNNYNYTVGLVNEATSYTWNLPSGWNGSSSSNTISVSPGSNPGTITVTANNPCGVGASQTFNIDTYSPEVQASASEISICSGESVTLSATGADSYLWSTGGAGSTTVYPELNTTYTVTGTDANGCQGTDQIAIAVAQLPIVAAQASDEEICDDEFITLNATGALSYVWNNGVSTGVPFSPSTTTTYTVTGLGANGCSNTDNITIVVHSLANMQANANTESICEGGELILFGTGALSYNWNQNVENGVPFFPTTTNTYVVTGTDEFGCTNSDAITIEVTPQPDVQAQASSTTICFGNTVILSGDGADIYNWNNAVQDGVAFSPLITATYTVVGVSNSGCTDTDVITIEVVDNPTVIANASATEVCAGSQILLYGEGAQTYQWSDNAQNNVAFTPNLTTTYSVTGTDENGCTDTDEVEVVVNQLPVILFSISQDTICTIDPPIILNATPGGGTYSGPGLSDNVFNPSGLAEGLYNITYIYTNGDGCTNSSTQQVNVEICGSVFDETNESEIALFPNPAEQWLNVSWSTESAVMSITDASGRKVSQWNVSGKRQHTLDVSDLAPGVYFIGMNSERGLVSMVFVVR